MFEEENGDGDYSLTYTFEDKNIEEQVFPTQDIKSNDSFSDATLLNHLPINGFSSFSLSLQASLHKKKFEDQTSSKDVDYYLLNIPFSGELSVSIENINDEDCSLTLDIFYLSPKNEFFSPVCFSSLDNIDGNKTLSINMLGSYYFVVSTSGDLSKEVNYTLKVEGNREENAFNITQEKENGAIGALWINNAIPSLSIPYITAFSQGKVSYNKENPYLKELERIDGTGETPLVILSIFDHKLCSFVADLSEFVLDYDTIYWNQNKIIGEKEEKTGVFEFSSYPWFSSEFMESFVSLFLDHEKNTFVSSAREFFISMLSTTSAGREDSFVENHYFSIPLLGVFENGTLKWEVRYPNSSYLLVYKTVFQGNSISDLPPYAINEGSYISLTANASFLA